MHSDNGTINSRAYLVPGSNFGRKISQFILAKKSANKSFAFVITDLSLFASNGQKVISFRKNFSDCMLMSKDHMAALIGKTRSQDAESVFQSTKP